MISPVDVPFGAGAPKATLETFGGAIGTETVDTETLDDALGGVLGAGNGGKSLGGVFGTGTGTTGIARDPLEAEPEADTLSPSLKSGNSSDLYNILWITT